MADGAMKTIIGFDLDGVIINHSKLKMRLASEFGCELRIEQTGSETMKSLLPREVYEKIQYFLYEDLETGVTQPLMSGVKGNLRTIKKSCPYFLISRRRSEQGRKNAAELLKARGLWPDYFNEKNVFFVFSREDKNVTAKKLGITHYVDDESSVLEKLTDVENRFLFDPFGSAELPVGCVAVRSWNELPKCLNVRRYAIKK